MKIIKPSFQILSATSNMTRLIELAIRTAYKSEDRIGPGSDEKIIDLIKSKKHESTLEHGSISVKIVCDRGVSHELVRHRIASFTQESTRYCNYSKDKFDKQVTFIDPFFFDVETSKRSEQYASWRDACEATERVYLSLLDDNKATAQEARSVLPNSLKTEVFITANVREWRKIFELRTAVEAHPQMRQVMCPMLEVFRKHWPILFNDVGTTEHTHPAVHIPGAEVKRNIIEIDTDTMTYEEAIAFVKANFPIEGGGPGWEHIGLDLPG